MNVYITNLINTKISKSSPSDVIMASEEREVFHEINRFLSDNYVYNTAITFTCLNGTMAPHPVTGPITFTKNTSGAKDQACMYLRLISNGTHIPNFDAFVEANTSKGWDNTAGALNVVLFWYDGTDYWFTIFQPVGSGGGGIPALTTPGSFTATPSSSTQIDLAWIDTNSSPNETGFRIYRNTVNVFGSATLINTTSANATSYNDTGRTPSTQYYYWIQAVGDGTTATSSGNATANATTPSGGGGTAYLTYAVKNETTEINNGLQSTASGTNYGRYGRSVETFAPGNYLQFKNVIESSSVKCIGFTSTATPSTSNALPDMLFGVFLFNDGTVWTNVGGTLTQIMGITYAANDLFRITWDAGTSDMQIAQSTDSGATWTDIGPAHHETATNPNALVILNGPSTETDNILKG